MLIMFDFTVVQMRYFKSAMDLIPSLRPDGKTPTMVQNAIDATASVRTEYVLRRNDVDGARSLRVTSIQTLHDACVDFLAQALSRYRKNPTIIARLRKLPVNDESFQKTMTRADLTHALWTDLPLVLRADGTMGPFTFGQGAVDVTQLAFAALQATAKAADTAIPVVDGLFQGAEATMHATLADMEDFVQAAFSQGRSRFDEGTPQRDIIESVPESSPQSAPAKAIIESAVAAGPTSVALEFGAERATTWDVLHRLAGAPNWTTVADDIIAREFTVTGLAPGDHEFAVVGRNSRGVGPQSDVAAVTL